MSVYVVIGSNSFSGISYINHLLNNNKKVIALSRSNFKKPILNPILNKNVTFKKFDINKDTSSLPKFFQKKNKYIFVNFSAQGMVAESWKNPRDWYQTNILGQVDFVKTIIDSRIKVEKFIQFSTPEVYGSTLKGINEKFKFNPTTPYAISRACFDNHLQALFNNFNFPVIFTRTANVYGPYQDLYRIIPKTFLSILNKKKLSLHGGGTSTRSFIHIQDVCKAIDKIIINGKLGETYHISTEEFISIKNLVKIISKKMKVDHNKLIKESKDRKGKDQQYILSINKIKKQCKWKPEISLNEGLEDTMSWINKNYNKLKNEKLEYVHKR